MISRERIFERNLGSKVPNYKGEKHKGQISQKRHGTKIAQL